MLPNPDNSQVNESALVFARAALKIVSTAHPGNHSVFASPTAQAGPFRAATRLDVSQIEGTVGAAVPPNEAQSYDRGSRAFINDVPFGRGQPHGAEVVPGIRASLITELREISGQVNRMMSQVDRAIHRLGEHAGAPLKR